MSHRCVQEDGSMSSVGRFYAEMSANILRKRPRNGSGSRSSQQATIMGQSLSQAGVQRTRDVILLALRKRFPPDEASRVSPLSAHALAAFRRLDPDANGWIASSSLDAVVQCLGLSQRWSRLEIDSFARLFVLEEPEMVSGAAPTSSRLDYELFLDVVFFPVTMASYEIKPTAKRLLKLTQYAVVLREQFGCVVHGGSYGDREVSVKEFRLNDGDKEVLLVVDPLRSYVNGLRLAGHPNLVQYKTTVQSNQSLYIVEDVFPSCTLHTILASFGAMKEATVRRYMVQVLEALEYLHAKDVVHGCLCMESINIDSYGQLKLSDFGVGSVLRSMKEVCIVVEGKSGDDDQEMVNQFPPPEATRCAVSTKAMDVWCVGVLILQMINGLQNSTQSRTNTSLYNTPTPPAVTTVKPRLASAPAIPSSLSKQLRDVVRACLQLSARKRPTIREVLALDFFQIDHSQSTNELLRDVCSDLDASMKRLASRPSSSNSSATTRGLSWTKQTPPAPARSVSSTNRGFSSCKQHY